MTPEIFLNDEAVFYDRTPDYIPSDELQKAVNLAIYLGRPLLLQGDPGCGKTSLAKSVAKSLRLGDVKAFHVKSTSCGQDLLYTYDAVKRLYDLQIEEKRPKYYKNQPSSENISKYIKYGPLGEAIIDAENNSKRSVVLIDEIDKADLDFPNDLLYELDECAFKVSELQKEYKVPDKRPDLRPIVIITHNEEKPLPPAFLRRCIYFYVEMPTEEDKILEILKVHDLGHEKPGLDKEQQEKIVEINKVAYDAITELRKMDLSQKPGLSELIDWVGYAQYIKKKNPNEEINKFCYLEALIKNHKDQQRFKQQNADANISTNQ